MMDDGLDGNDFVSEYDLWFVDILFLFFVLR